MRIEDIVFRYTFIYRARLKFIVAMKHLWSLIWDIEVDATQRLVQRLFLGFERPCTVLDVACGMGNLPDEVLKRGETPELESVSFLGLDMSPQMVRVASEHMRVVQGSATRLPLGDGEVDYVSMNFLLHHMSGAMAREALREAHRVARRGIIITEVEVPTRRLIGIWPHLYWKLIDGGVIYRTAEEWRDLLGPGWEKHAGIAFDRVFVKCWPSNS